MPGLRLEIFDTAAAPDALVFDDRVSVLICDRHDLIVEGP